MSIYSIYRCTNTITNKCYIGFDSNWPNRKNYHKCYYTKQNYKFYLSIRKHGWENFIWEIIYQSIEGQHCLDIMEPYFIKEYDSFYNGYNSTLGGDGMLGFKHSEESKLKTKIKNTGRKHSTNWCNNISKGLKGKKRPDMVTNNPMKNPLISIKFSGGNHPKAIPITLNGVYYSHKRQAMKELNLNKNQLNKLLSANLT